MQTVGQYLGQPGPVISQHDVTDEYRARCPFKTERERFLEEGRPDESFPEWKERVRRGS